MTGLVLVPAGEWWLRRWRQELGSVVLLLMLMLVTVIVPIMGLTLDVSLLMVARNEAQNAADAGALAGAVSLLHDTGDAESEARAFASANRILNAAPETITVTVIADTCAVSVSASRRLVFRQAVTIGAHATARMFPAETPPRVRLVE